MVNSLQNNYKNMKYKKNIDQYWLQALKFEKENNIEEADKMLDYCLVLLAEASQEGITDDQYFYGTKKYVWYERIWTKIEKLGLLPE
jgi:hypothetical protein